MSGGKPSRSIVAAALACAAIAVLPSAAHGRSAAATAILACDPAALQAAITSANTAGSGRIKLPPHCIYSIVTPSTATEALPVITGDITIIGSKSTVIARSPIASTAFRIFTVDPGGKLTLNGLTIQNGSTTGLGGGILDSGTLVLQRVNITNNAAGNGGAVSVSAGATGTFSDVSFFLNATTGVGGGGVLNNGTLTVTKSRIADNTAPINGGGINTQASGVTTVVRSTIENNTSGSLGGGLSNLGTTTIDHSTVKNNTGSSGGGIATGNTSVFLKKSTVAGNNPDNCSPLNTIPGCRN